MSKKLNCHSRIFLMEDPNAATARELKHMYKQQL
jgi:hypothetical protein